MPCGKVFYPSEPICKIRVIKPVSEFWGLHELCDVNHLACTKWSIYCILWTVEWNLKTDFAFSCCCCCFFHLSYSAGKESTCNARDLGSIPGLGRSPEEGKGYSFQYSCLENSMDCIGHGVAKSRTRLSDFYFHFHTDLRIQLPVLRSMFSIVWLAHVIPTSGVAGS